MKHYLHIGCGPIHIPSTPEVNWTNIDHQEIHRPDIVMDCLNLAARFDQWSIDGIWSCHMLEHLNYPRDTQWFLSGCHYILKPGSIIRLAVPDLEKIAAAYVRGDGLEFIYGKEFKGYYYKDCPAERFHFFMHAWEHKIVFDFRLLFTLLQEAGFTNVKRQHYNRSDNRDFHHDRFESESLYVEATA